MVPEVTLTPAGPLEPQYLTPSIDRWSYEQELWASTLNEVRLIGVAGTPLMVHASLAP